MLSFARAMSLRGRDSKKRGESVSDKRPEESDVDQNSLDADSAILKAKTSGHPPVSGNRGGSMSQRIGKMQVEALLIENEKIAAAGRQKAFAEVQTRARTATDWYEMIAGINRDLVEVWNNDQADEVQLVKKIAIEMYNNGEFYPWVPDPIPQTEFNKNLEARVHQSMEQLDSNPNFDYEVERATRYTSTPLPDEDSDQKETPRKRNTYGRPESP